MKGIHHLFWDFDGTLYDSYPQLLHSFTSGLKALSLDHLWSKAEILKRLKVSVYHAALVCAAESGKDVQEIMNSYRVFHEQESSFPPYGGLEQCLKTLHDAGYHHYLYTHRDRSAVDQLKQDDLWKLFDDAVLRTDGYPDKPAPDALLAMMERNHLSAAECAMIGDRDIDLDAGHNAGMSGILFDPDGFYAGYPAEMSVSSMAELCRMLLSE